MSPFTIDLDKPEFSTQLEESELWQRVAWDRLFEVLDEAIVGAKTYAQQRSDNPKEHAAYHNAIYVYGGRGSGKTVFLKNIKRRWKSMSGSKAKLHITSTIDPTLLHNHDSFANVVVAQIYSEVEQFFKGNTVDENVKQEFYKSLKGLADAIAQSGELADHVGIDRIIKYRSGVQVESLFHRFIESACKSLGSEAIAVPIDDVDMALTKAFEVLDVVRRLLSCPLIVPIVSGDTNLYQQITELHFQKELKEASAGKELAQQLNSAYLTKIFPNQYRIGLVGVGDILPNLSIKGEKGERSYQDYQRALFNRYYYLINGEERSRDWPAPETPREIQQLLSTIPLDQPSRVVEEKEWARFKQWAEQKQHGIAYTNAESEKVCNLSSFENFDINRLMAFSPILQNATNLTWAEKDFAAEQLEAINRLSSESDKRGNIKLVQAGLGDHYRVLRSMPPVELHANSMIVPGKDGKNNSMLISMYTHRDYYTTMANTTAKVFFSRAFELLVTSLVKPKLQSEPQWVAYLTELIKRPPFYSIHAISPTKYVNDGSDELESEDEGEEIDEQDDPAEEVTSTLAKRMSGWQVKHQYLLLKLETEPSLLPLIHNAFNKVFSLLQLFKEKGGVPLEGEKLPDFIRRFEYITVNAFAAFLVTKKVVVKANTAQMTSLDTLREYSKFKRYDRVFTRNVAHLLNLESRAAVVKEDIGARTLEAIWDHPVFNLHGDEDDAEYLLGKRKTDNSATSKNNISKNKKRSIPKSKSVESVSGAAGGAQPAIIMAWAAKNQTPKEIDQTIKKIETEMKDYLADLSDRTKVKKVLNGLKQALESGK